MSWGYWGIVTGILILVTVFFFCVDLLYRSDTTSEKRVPDATAKDESRHAA